MNIFSKAGFTKFSRGERGASAIEYALLVAMVAIAIVAFVDPINAAVTAIFASIQAALT